MAVRSKSLERPRGWLGGGDNPGEKHKVEGTGNDEDKSGGNAGRSFDGEGVFPFRFEPPCRGGGEGGKNGEAANIVESEDGGAHGVDDG